MRRKTIFFTIAGITLLLATLFLLHIYRPTDHRLLQTTKGPQPAAKSPLPTVPSRPLAATWPTAHLSTSTTTRLASTSSNNQPTTNNLLSAGTALIAGLTPDRDYQHRLAAIRSLNNRLPAADVACLMAYLADPATAKPGNLWDLGLKNDTLAVLLRQERLPEGMGSMLVNIVSNRTQDLTWRDYALQVVPAYAGRTPGRADTENQALRTVLDAALTERGTVLPGTALIAMSRLSGTDGLYDTNTVARQAHQILDQSAPGDPARITAIQILAQTDVSAARDIARGIAKDESRPVLERMSAIAALGRVGQAEDAVWLREMIQRPGLDKRLKTAAEANVKHLVIE